MSLQQVINDHPAPGIGAHHPGVSQSSLGGPAARPGPPPLSRQLVHSYTPTALALGIDLSQAFGTTLSSGPCETLAGIKLFDDRFEHSSFFTPASGGESKTGFAMHGVVSTHGLQQSSSLTTLAVGEVEQWVDKMLDDDSCFNMALAQKELYEQQAFVAAAGAGATPAGLHPPPPHVGMSLQNRLVESPWPQSQCGRLWAPPLQLGVQPSQPHLDQFAPTKFPIPSDTGMAPPPSSLLFSPAMSKACMKPEATHCAYAARPLVSTADAPPTFAPSNSNSGVGSKPATTLMIRNIPLRYTRDMLLEEWSNNGAYDYLYLPDIGSSKQGIGYAFVNFATDMGADEFRARWHNGRLSKYTAQRPLNIVLADVQGLFPNLKQFQRKRGVRVRDEQHRPVVFHEGTRVPIEVALHVLGLPMKGEGVQL